MQVCSAALGALTAAQQAGGGGLPSAVQSQCQKQPAMRRASEQCRCLLSAGHWQCPAGVSHEQRRQGKLCLASRPAAYSHDASCGDTTDALLFCWTVSARAVGKHDCGPSHRSTAVLGYVCLWGADVVGVQGIASLAALTLAPQNVFGGSLHGVNTVTSEPMSCISLMRFENLQHSHAWPACLPA